MAMVTDMAMVTVMDMAMVAMDITATMARGRLRPLLLLSLAMDTTAMDTDMDMVTVMAMEAMAMDIMAITARGLLMLSPAMATTAMDMDMDMDMATTVTDMATAMATTDKFLLLFSAVESSVQTKNLDHLVLVLNFKILNKLFDK